MITPWQSVVPVRYGCEHRVINSGSASLEIVTGVHQAGKSNNDVKYLNILEQDLPLFPKESLNFSKTLTRSQFGAHINGQYLQMIYNSFHAFCTSIRTETTRLLLTVTCSNTRLILSWCLSIATFCGTFRIKR